MGLLLTRLTLCPAVGPPTLHLATATVASESDRGGVGHTASAQDTQDAFDLQACLRRASPQVLSVPISEQRCFGGRPFPLTLVPASAPNARWHLAGWSHPNPKPHPDPNPKVAPKPNPKPNPNPDPNPKVAPGGLVSP